MVLKWRSGEHSEGELSLVEEDWYQDGKWHKTGPADMGGDRILLTEPDGIKFYHYENSEGRVVRLNELGPQVSTFTVEDVAPRFLPTGAQTRETDLGSVIFGGQQTTLYEVATTDGSERVLFWLRPGTDLPIHAEKQDRENGEWKVYGTLDFEFGLTLPPSTFDPASLDHASRHSR